MSGGPANGLRCWQECGAHLKEISGNRAYFLRIFRLVVSQKPENIETFEVAIIGAGFAGLCMAAKLREAGIRDFVVLERGDSVGGTWRDNTYPGCACDVPSHFYSYSFRLNGEWSEVFPPWHEIRDYLTGCANRYGLESHLRLRTGVEEIRYDEAQCQWVLALDDGSQLRARFVVGATGPLTKPLVPEIAGLDGFGGRVFHSAHWDHGYDLRDKHVAVIGTGASAIQIVPALADRVAHLDLYQRTAPWLLPRLNRRYGKVARWVYRHFPAARRFTRWVVYWRLEQFAFAVLRNRWTRRLFERIGLWHLRRQVEDPVLRAKLRPGFRLGCKRALLSDHYYLAVKKKRVELVTEPIAGVTPGGIMTADGIEHPVDAIILATGFRATEFVSPLRVHGRGGRELSAYWKEDAPSYLGISVAGFPNFFLLVGPNTGLGHSSIVFMIEAQVRYVIGALKTARKHGWRSVEVGEEAQAEYTQEIQTRLRGTAWQSGCRSFYLSANGRNYMMWPGSTVEYWRRTRGFDPAAYVVG